MGPSELIRMAADALDRLGIDYLITGSMASIAYGEPRFTNDADIAIRATPAQARALADAFPEPDFYASADAAEQAARAHSQFNVIHPESGLKVDFMVTAPDSFNDSRFSRARLLATVEGDPVRYASPEDVILRKLQYFKAGGSDKHLRDIRSILKVTSDIDINYVERWLDDLDVRSEWKRITEP